MSRQGRKSVTPTTVFKPASLGVHRVQAPVRAENTQESLSDGSCEVTPIKMPHQPFLTRPAGCKHCRRWPPSFRCLRAPGRHATRAQSPAAEDSSRAHLGRPATLRPGAGLRGRGLLLSQGPLGIVVRPALSELHSPPAPAARPWPLPARGTGSGAAPCPEDWGRFPPSRRALEAQGLACSGRACSQVLQVASRDRAEGTEGKRRKG